MKQFVPGSVEWLLAYRASGVQQLSEFEKQVLVAVSKDCRPNSEIKGRHWANPPTHGPFEPVEKVVRRLLSLGFLRCRKKRWWQVQPTDAGKEIIEAERLERIELRATRWRKYRIEASERIAA